MSLRIAYLTGESPRATDTFIQREVAGLRRGTRPLPPWRLSKKSSWNFSACSGLHLCHAPNAQTERTIASETAKHIFRFNDQIK